MIKKLLFQRVEIPEGLVTSISPFLVGFLSHSQGAVLPIISSYTAGGKLPESEVEGESEQLCCRSLAEWPSYGIHGGKIVFPGESSIVTLRGQ